LIQAAVGLAGGMDGIGLAKMHLVGCHQPNAAVVVVLVVPIEEAAAELHLVVPPAARALCRWGGAAGHGVHGPLYSCAANGTWCGLSSGNGLRRAGRHRFRRELGKRSVVHAAGRAPPSLVVRSKPVPASAAGGAVRSARSGVRAGASRWRVKPRARHRPLASFRCRREVRRRHRSGLAVVRRR
jgi:hypothetical protein